MIVTYRQRGVYVRLCGSSQSNYTIWVLYFSFCFPFFTSRHGTVITQRVQQLQGSMDDASNRLVPAEAARSKWINPTELNPQQVQQHLDQLKVRGVNWTVAMTSNPSDAEKNFFFVFFFFFFSYTGTER